MPPKKQPPK
jgi:hypothetical protein